MEARYLYSLTEVAELTGLTKRWLADQCRAGKIDHTHIENSRRMTLDQIDSLIGSHRRGPNREDDAAREKFLGRLAQKQRQAHRKSDAD